MIVPSSSQCPTHKKSPKVWPAILLAAVTLMWAAPTASADDFDAAEFIDLADLQAIDANWEITKQEGDDANGRLQVSNDKWLMYFLHWRPLTDSMSDLTHEYARHHLLNFWGENMPFELSGVEGETEINRHRALITEGTIYDSTVSTRFILWNCPETGRQFTSDCNINLRAGTPPHYLEVQREITESIRCHPPHESATTASLPRTYGPSPWQVSFSIPDRWRTNDFEYKEWFPDSLSIDNGSLWTLLSDSERRISLRWATTDRPASEHNLSEFLEGLPGDSAIMADTSLTLTVEIDTVGTTDGHATANGTLVYTQMVQGQEYVSKYVFRALQWRKSGRRFTLIASLAAIDSFWGMPVDLLPTEDDIDQFLQDEVLAHLTALGRR